MLLLLVPGVGMGASSADAIADNAHNYLRQGRSLNQGVRSHMRRIMLSPAWALLGGF